MPLASTHAQTFDVGIGFEAIQCYDEVYLTSYDPLVGTSVRKQVRTSQDASVFPRLSVQFGFSLPIRLKDNQAIAFHPLVTGGYAKSRGQFTGSYGLFVLYQYGAGSTRHADKKWGFGLGPGYRVVGVTHDVGSGTILKTPALMAELAYKTENWGIFKLQIMYHLKHTAERFSQHYKDNAFEVYFRTKDPLCVTIIGAWPLYKE